MLIDDVKKEERKIYKKYFLFIVTGIIIGAIGFKLTGWFANLLVIFAGLIVIVNLSLFSTTFDNYYKMKGRLREEQTGEPFKETYIEWPAWLNKYGWILSSIILTLGIGLFAAMHENYFGLRFLGHSVLFGLVAGFAANSLLKLRYTNWSSSPNKSNEITFYIVLLSVFISVCLGPSVNKYFTTNELHCDNYRLLSYDKNYKTGSKYIHVLVKGENERFNPSYSFFEKLSNKDSVVTLCWRKGLLGYEYVEEFRLPE
jgi:hypothetical protein